MRTRIAALAAVTVLLLAACATRPGGGEPGPSASGEVAPGDPVGLVNLWRVSDAAGEDPDTWWRAEPGSYALIRPCGVVGGGWRASAHVFVAARPDSWHQACSDGSDRPSVPWLEQAVAYQSDGNGFRLLGADGRALATLTLDGVPGPIPGASDTYRQPPEVTDDVRAALGPPAALPDGLEPVTEQTLLGRWDVRPEDLTSFLGGTAGPVSPGLDPYPHLEVLDDGTWTGTDGCNGSGGAWTVDDDGWVLVTSGASTLMGCDGAPAPSWFASAERAGRDGDTLVLTDHAGVEIARLVRG